MINRPIQTSMHVDFTQMKKEDFVKLLADQGEEDQQLPCSRNTSKANLKISLPISKIKASKKKNKKSFLSFITTLVRAQKAFSYLFKIERVSRRLSA